VREEEAAVEATGAADRTFRIVFAGDAAVGKSTFITRLHRGIFTVDSTTTLGKFTPADASPDIVSVISLRRSDAGTA